MLALRWNFLFKCHTLALILHFVRPEMAFDPQQLSWGRDPIITELFLFRASEAISGPNLTTLPPTVSSTVSSVKQPRIREIAALAPQAPLRKLILTGTWVSLRQSLQ